MLTVDEPLTVKQQTKTTVKIMAGRTDNNMKTENHNHIEDNTEQH